MLPCSTVGIGMESALGISVYQDLPCTRQGLSTHFLLCMQAVLALRHAALSSWAALPQDSKQSVLSFLLQHTLHNAAAAPPPQQDAYSQQQLLVQTQCAATVAALVKRGWEDMAVEERHALMQGIDSAAAQAGTFLLRCRCLLLIGCSNISGQSMA